MVKWISIKEQPPPRYTGLLITDGKHIAAAEQWRDGYWQALCVAGPDWEWEDIDIDGITHWADLPKLPETEE